MSVRLGIAWLLGRMRRASGLNGNKSNTANKGRRHHAGGRRHTEDIRRYQVFPVHSLHASCSKTAARVWTHALSHTSQPLPRAMPGKASQVHFALLREGPLVDGELHVGAIRAQATESCPQLQKAGSSQCTGHVICPKEIQLMLPRHDVCTCRKSSAGSSEMAIAAVAQSAYTSDTNAWTPTEVRVANAAFVYELWHKSPCCRCLPQVTHICIFKSLLGSCFSSGR